MLFMLCEVLFMLCEVLFMLCEVLCEVLFMLCAVLGDVYWRTDLSSYVGQFCLYAAVHVAGRVCTWVSILTAWLSNIFYSLVAVNCV
jgi:hypothetical protein